MRKTKHAKCSCTSSRQTLKNLERKSRLKTLILVVLIRVLSILGLLLDHYWTMS